MTTCGADPTPPTPIAIGNNLTMFRYEALPPGELPGMCMEDHHILAVIDLSTGAIFEESIGDTRYHPQLKGYGSVTLIPAGVSHHALWHQSISLTTFHLSRSFLDRIAEKRLKVSKPILLPKRHSNDQVLYHLTMALQTSLLSNPHQSPESPYNQYLITALAWRLVTHHSLNYLQPSPSSNLDPSHGLLDLTVNQINKLVLCHAGQSLTDTEVRVLSGVLRGYRYREIAHQHHQSEGHIKTVAAELWQILSRVLGQPVRKSNLRSALQQHGLLSS